MNKKYNNFKKKVKKCINTPKKVGYILKNELKMDFIPPKNRGGSLKKQKPGFVPAFYIKHKNITSQP